MAKHWKFFVVGFFVLWVVLFIVGRALVEGGRGQWIELFNGATWPPAFVLSKENPQPAYDFTFYVILSLRALLNLGVVFTATVVAYLLVTGRLGKFMSKIDSIFRTQNLAVATLVLQLLEDKGVDVPEPVEEAVLKAVREFGVGENDGVFKKRLVKAANSSH